MAANVPTLAVYVDYQKTYDPLWHAALTTKLGNLEIPHCLLTMIVSWLSSRSVYLVIGKEASVAFQIHIGLPQGSSHNLYLFVLFYSDLIHSLGAHSDDLFADDVCVLIRPLAQTKFAHKIEFTEKEATKVCARVFGYSER